MFLLCAAAFLAVACCDKEEPVPTPENPANPSDTTQVDPSIVVSIPNAVTDIDGNSYDAVRIGEQVWMASNLRTTRYANGDAIPEGQLPSYTEPYRYTPSTNVEEYGYLYNWAAVMHGASSSTANPSGVQGICPNGWHVPSDAEWSQLTGYVGSHSEYVCSGNGDHIAKALAADHGWQITADNECAVGYDQSNNNATGFSAHPVANGMVRSHSLMTREVCFCGAHHPAAQILRLWGCHSMAALQLFVVYKLRIFSTIASMACGRAN